MDERDLAQIGACSDTSFHPLAECDQGLLGAGAAGVVVVAVIVTIAIIAAQPPPPVEPSGSLGVVEIP